MARPLAPAPAPAAVSVVTVVMMASTADHPGLANARDCLRRNGFADPTAPPPKPPPDCPAGTSMGEVGKSGEAAAAGAGCALRWRVVGLGEEWGGWRHRMARYRDAAAALAREDRGAVMVCADAYDALSVRHGAGLAEVFAAFRRPLVLSLERVCLGNCVPIDEWWRGEGRSHLAAARVRPPRPPVTKYVNGGLLMGYAWAVRELYDWMLRTGQDDDQRGLARYALAHPDHWAPDIRGVLFKNRVYGETLDERDLRGEGAYFAHFPGMRHSSIRGYDQALWRMLRRPSGLTSLELGSPEAQDARLLASVLGYIALALALLLLAAWALAPPGWRRAARAHFFPARHLGPAAPAVNPS